MQARSEVVQEGLHRLLMRCFIPNVEGVLKAFSHQSAGQGRGPIGATGYVVSSVRVVSVLSLIIPDFRAGFSPLFKGRITGQGDPVTR